MKKRTKHQQTTYGRLISQCWEFSEEMPEAGIIALYRWGTYCSIKRNGVVYPGNLCDKFRR